MTWLAPEPEAVDGPVTGPDRPMLEGYLNYQRSTFLSLCAGLTAEQLARRPSPPSTLSLLGLIRHLTKVERIWLRIRAAGEDIDGVFPLGVDIDFTDTDPLRAPAELAALVEEMRAGDAAAAPLDFDHVYDWPHDTWSLRMTYVHLIGEYARHNGHADLLREAIDGVTGR